MDAFIPCAFQVGKLRLVGSAHQPKATGCQVNFKPSWLSLEPIFFFF